MSCALENPYFQYTKICAFIIFHLGLNEEEEKPWPNYIFATEL